MHDARRGPRIEVLFAALLVLVACVLVGPGQGTLVGHASAGEGDAYTTLLDAAFDEFEARRFQAALDLFEKAAKVSRTGEVLFNIGACHEYLGNPEEAVKALRESIQLGISAALQDRARRKIEALEQRLEPEEASPTTAQVEQQGSEGVTSHPVDDEWHGRRRTLQAVGGGLLGGGAAVVGVGGVLWGLAWSENSQISAAADTSAKQGHIDAVQRYALAGDITAGVGAAVAVSGLVISLVGGRCQPPGADRTEVALHPAVLPLPDGGVAFVVGGEF